MDEFSELTVFRRFVTGPPGVPDNVLETQQNAFETAVTNDKFLAEAREAARPLISPEAGSDPVDAALEKSVASLNEAVSGDHPGRVRRLSTESDVRAGE